MTNPHKNMSREEIAAIEVGHTDIHPVLARALVLVFWITILVVPLHQVIHELRVAEAPVFGLDSIPDSLRVGQIYPAREELETLLKSKSLGEAFRESTRIDLRILARMDGYEDSLEDSSVIYNTLLPSVQDVLIGRLRGGNEQAYCGRDSWLFYRPGIDYLTGRGFLDTDVLEERRLESAGAEQFVEPDPVAAIIEFGQQLALRDIQLVILPAPTKAMVYPEQFSSRYDAKAAPLQNVSYESFRNRVEQAGVRVFDPTPLLHDTKSKSDEALFLKTDTHWTPHGMKLVADGLADYLRAEDLVQDVAQLAYRLETTELANSGDIAAMLQLPEHQTYYPTEGVSIETVWSPDGSLWQSDIDSEILFLGDSYANIYSLSGMGWGEGAGFVEHLSARLGQPIDAIRRNDNGAFATREALSRALRRGTDRLRGKKTVVYEFAIRELTEGNWKTGLSLSTANMDTTRRAEVEAMIVTGTIRDITRPPRPGSVPYRDCVVAIHLTNAEGTDGDMVAFTWGMRGNQWTLAARYNIGDVLTLTLAPWSQVEQRYGSYTRIELDSEESLFLDAYWVNSGENEELDRPTSESPEGRTRETLTTTKPDGSDESVETTFSRELSEIVSRLETDGRTTFRGIDDWLFFAPELRSMSVGPFWGDAAKTVSRATNPDYADPLTAIMDFHKQLEGAGIELLLVPVPPKVAVYPDKIYEGSPINTAPLRRLDTSLQTFYEMLREHGVEVLDLTDHFMERRDSASAPLFCKQDTHWSGLACEMAAEAISTRVGAAEWLEEIPKQNFATRDFDLTMTGDLWTELGDPSLPKETLSMKRIVSVTEEVAPKDWRESPIVLLGDSHSLVFHVGQDMHTSGAGLADHLAATLGFPMDVVAVRGSGATPARMSLLRRRDNLSGKKLVIWCFTAREFTEAQGGWRPLPVIR